MPSPVNRQTTAYSAMTAKKIAQVLKNTDPASSMSRMMVSVVFFFMVAEVLSDAGYCDEVSVLEGVRDGEVSGEGVAEFAAGAADVERIHVCGAGVPGLSDLHGRERTRYADASLVLAFFCE